MRLLITIASTLLLVFIIGLTLRMWGLNQTSTYFESDYFSEVGPDIIALGGVATDESGADPYSLEAYREAARIHSDLILGADVFLTKDKELVVLSPEAAQTFGGPKYLQRTNFEEINPRPLKLREFVEQFPQRKLYLEFYDNVDGIHELVTEALQNINLEDRVLIRSRYDLISQAIKDSEPLWLYGSGHGERTRFLALRSLFLEPLMFFKADVYVTPLHWQNRQVIDVDLMEELTRRQRRVVVGPIDTPNELAIVRQLDVDAILTRKPLWITDSL